MKKIALLFAYCALTRTISAQIWPQVSPHVSGQQLEERVTMITNINHGAGLAWRATVIQKMLLEANWAADRLKLPTKRPIQITDIIDNHVSLPSSSMLFNTNGFPDTIYGTHIYDTNIPREFRLRALKIGVYGRIDTTNFEFGFSNGKLCRVTRMDDTETEYYARRLDELIGKPSLIDTNGAYQLATQWLAAVDMDMPALNKLKWTVNQLHYKARGATNYVTLPLFYVDFGNIHYPASGNLHAFDEPMVSVEVLGTTKELQNLDFVYDLSLSRRPPMLITNILDLVHTSDPPEKRLNAQPILKTNSTSPP